MKFTRLVAGLTVLAISLPVFAQQRGEIANFKLEVNFDIEDMYKRDRNETRRNMNVNEVVRNANETTALINRLAKHLSQSELNQIDQLLRQTRNIVYGYRGRDNDRRDEGRGRLQRSINVRGHIERTLEYNFDVTSQEELVEKCVALVKSKGIGNVDEMTVSVNREQPAEKSTSSWWRGANDICIALNGFVKAKAQLPLSHSDYKYILIGAVELTKLFTFKANSIKGIDAQCLEFYTQNIRGNTDDMKLSINFGPMQEYSTSSWWRSSFDLCSYLTTKVSQSVPGSTR